MKLHPNLFLPLVLLATFAGGSSADSIGDTLGGNKFKKTLFTGDEIRSRNGSYRLVMQPDCNLVFYGPSDNVIWASNTQNVGKLCVLHLSGGDTPAYGNALYITDYQRKTIWSYSNHSNGDCYLKVDDKGALLFPCVKTLSSTTITNPSGNKYILDTLGGPECNYSPWYLKTGQYLTSKNGAYRLVMQADCNLVLYHRPSGAALWASETARSGTSLCAIYTIGPINSELPEFKYDCFGDAIYMRDYKGKLVWSIEGNGYCGLTVKNNGHLIFKCNAYVYGIGDPRKQKSAMAAQLLLSAAQM